MSKKTFIKEKIGLILIVIFILIAAGAGIWLYVLNKHRSIDANDSTATGSVTVQDQNGSPIVTKSAASKAQTDWHTYSNSQYHFALEFSDAWKDYSVAQDENLPDKATTDFAFKLKTSDPAFNKTAAALTIYIFKQSDFDAAKSSFSSTEITRANGYVYTYRTWENSPSDLTFLTDKSIADVIKTFKTTN